MDTKRLKIGFLSVNNYFDRMSFSGILWCMHRALQRRVEVVPLGRPYHPNRFRDWLRTYESNRLGGVSCNGKPSAYLNKFCDKVHKQLRNDSVDVIFAPVASKELSAIRFDQPVLYASDATFRLLNASYELSLSSENAAELDAAERRAIDGAAGITYSSNWAADSAIEDYGATREKIRVIPYGANLIYIPDVNQAVQRCGKLPWKFVFLGLDWRRKGGDVALRIFQQLLKSGLDAELTIIGTTPPEGSDLTRVQVIPFLDKRKRRNRQQLWEILLSSHFMLFPSRADCTPIALCEAAAYGIPVIASDVGGVSTIVTEGNGRLMPVGSTPDDYTAAVLELVADPAKYRDLVRSARQRFEDVLNWDRWAQSLVTFCEHLL